MPKNYRKKLINNILNLNSNFMIIQSNLTGLKNKIKLKKTEETSSHVLNELQRDPRFKEVKQNNEKMNNIRKE